MPGIAVLSVGNLVVGGTGKTPFAAWAARALEERGARPAVVLRGYGRDEVALHRRWSPRLPVIVAPRRVRAVRAARDGGASVAVLDDGFQHRRVARDVDLVLLAVEDPLPPRLLPAGPYREPWSALGRAHAVVLTRRVAELDDARQLEEAVSGRFPGLPVACVRLALEGWQDLRGRTADGPRGPTLVVAAVARPEAFRTEVARATGAEAELMAFRDHHEFAPADVRRVQQRAAGRPVVVSEKDAVKLIGALRSSGGAPDAPERALPPVHVAAETLRWDWGEDLVRDLLDSLVARGRRPSGGSSARSRACHRPGPRDAGPEPHAPSRGRLETSRLPNAS